jgi:hypothetical protein
LKVEEATRLGLIQIEIEKCSLLKAKATRLGLKQIEIEKCRLLKAEAERANRENRELKKMQEKETAELMKVCSWTTIFM